MEKEISVWRKCLENYDWSSGPQMVANWWRGDFQSIEGNKGNKNWPPEEIVHLVWGKLVIPLEHECMTMCQQAHR